MKKNLLVAQSGGPTAAINATLAGVIKQAIKEEQIDQVYGACYGIQGVLEQKFVNLTEKVDTEEKLEKLKRTPAAALGSCRFKLNDIKEDDSQYQAKSPANCDAHLAESIFQIRSRRSRLYSWLLFLLEKIIINLK